VRIRLLLCALPCALTAFLPPSAAAGVSEALNWARMSGCAAVWPRGAMRTPLRESPQLHDAAARLAGGASLHSALVRAGYLTESSSALHMTGAVSDSQIASLLASRYCATLVNVRLSEFGVERRGSEVWIVLASALAAPRLAEAAPAPAPHPAIPASADREILEVINAARAQGRRCGGKYYPPVAPLVFNPALTAAATVHSRDMASHAEFEHRGHDGSSPSQRVEVAGYAARVVGENIAAGEMTPAEAAKGWLASPPHCENIMDPRFTDTGIALAVNYAAPFRMYWTQDFAEPRNIRSASAKRGP